jgi:hypothetical protein
LRSRRSGCYLLALAMSTGGTSVAAGFEIAVTLGAGQTELHGTGRGTGGSGGHRCGRLLGNDQCWAEALRGFGKRTTLDAAAMEARGKISGVVGAAIHARQAESAKRFTASRGDWTHGRDGNWDCARAESGCASLRGAARGALFEIARVVAAAFGARQSVGETRVNAFGCGGDRRCRDGRERGGCRFAFAAGARVACEGAASDRAAGGTLRQLRGIVGAALGAGQAIGRRDGLTIRRRWLDRAHPEYKTARVIPFKGRRTKNLALKAGGVKGDVARICKWSERCRLRLVTGERHFRRDFRGGVESA